MPYCFSRLSVKYQGHRAKKYRFWPKIGIFRQFEFTDGYEMMLKSWSSIEAVPYFFSRSSVKFQGHKEKLSLILSGIERFRTVTPVWIHWWLWNSLQSLKWHRRGALLFARSSIKFQGHTGEKIANFDPNWAFLDCNCSLNSPMGLRWCTKLDVI